MTGKGNNGTCFDLLSFLDKRVVAKMTEDVEVPFSVFEHHVVPIPFRPATFRTTIVYICIDRRRHLCTSVNTNVDATVESTTTRSIMTRNRSIAHHLYDSVSCRSTNRSIYHFCRLGRISTIGRRRISRVPTTVSTISEGERIAEVALEQLTSFTFVNCFAKTRVELTPEIPTAFREGLRLSRWSIALVTRCISTIGSSTMVIFVSR